MVHWQRFNKVIKILRSCCCCGSQYLTQCVGGEVFEKWILCILCNQLGGRRVWGFYGYGSKARNQLDGKTQGVPHWTAMLEFDSLVCAAFAGCELNGNWLRHGATMRESSGWRGEGGGREVCRTFCRSGRVLWAAAASAACALCPFAIRWEFRNKVATPTPSLSPSPSFAHSLIPLIHFILCHLPGDTHSR